MYKWIDYIYEQRSIQINEYKNKCVDEQIYVDEWIVSLYLHGCMQDLC